MKVTPLALPEVLLIEPRVFGDERGFFYESWNQRAFARRGHSMPTFVQDNHSRSRRGVLRGLHYQIEHAQGKLVRATAGEVFDVAVDLRRSSPTFGRSVGVELSADNKRMLWIPPGFAHGFLVVSEDAEFLYKTTDFWYPEHERTLLWNDPALGIAWPLAGEPILAAKDAAGTPLARPICDLIPDDASSSPAPAARSAASSRGCCRRMARSSRVDRATLDLAQPDAIVAAMRAARPISSSTPAHTRRSISPSASATSRSPSMRARRKSSPRKRSAQGRAR